MEVERPLRDGRELLIGNMLTVKQGKFLGLVTTDISAKPRFAAMDRDVVIVNVLG